MFRETTYDVLNAAILATQALMPVAIMILNFSR